MCVAVLHSVIIGADITSFGRTIVNSAYNATLCNTAWGSFKERRRNFNMETDFDAATGSWRKSAVEFTEQTYGFLFPSRNSLLPFTQCAVDARAQKV
jgi:hypothetical protein